MTVDQLGAVKILSDCSTNWQPAPHCHRAERGLSLLLFSDVSQASCGQWVRLHGAPPDVADAGHQGDFPEWELPDDMARAQEGEMNEVTSPTRFSSPAGGRTDAGDRSGFTLTYPVRARRRGR